MNSTTNQLIEIETVKLLSADDASLVSSFVIKKRPAPQEILPNKIGTPSRAAGFLSSILKKKK
jgi:hypothetical protein